MSAVPHPHCLGDISVALVITVMYVNKWQDHILPARLLQDHNVLSTLQTFLKNPGRSATVTREELLGSTTDRSSLDCGQDGQARQFRFQNCPKEQAEGEPRRCCRSRKAMRRSSMRGDIATPQQQQSSTLWRTDEAKKSMSIRAADMEGGCNCTLHSSLQYTASRHSQGQRYRPIWDGEDQRPVLRTWRRRPSVHTEGSWSLRDNICCKHHEFSPRSRYQFSVTYALLLAIGQRNAPPFNLLIHRPR